MQNLDLIKTIHLGFEAWNSAKKSGAIKRISSVNFDEIDISHFDFSGLEIKDCNFIGTKINSCNFKNAEIFDTKFNNGAICETDFTESSLICCTLSDATITNTSFQRADIFGSNFNDCTLKHCDFRYVRANDADFYGALFQHVKAYGISIWNSKCKINIDSRIIITPDYEDPIVTHDLELAQYIYAMHKKGIVNMHKVALTNPLSSKTSLTYDLFISHASEDKVALVAPLAETLRAVGLRIWYDDFILLPGNSLRQMIDEGLSKSLIGLVVLSPNFFKKGWPQAELNAMFSMSVNSGRMLIPILHEITSRDVIRVSPLLSDVVAIVNDGDINKIAIKILQSIQEQKT